MFSIRLNRLSSEADSVLAALQRMGATVASVDWYADAYIVSGITINDATAHQLYNRGAFYIQNLASMIPALVLQVRPGETVLDVCAAPGSKTTQLAALMKNTGTIIACDISRDRLFKLKANCKRMLVTIADFFQMPGAFAWRKFPQQCDRVLADVPCSMGLPYASKNLKMLVTRQKKIIRSAFGALRPGCVMVYSTCSPRTEENENVVEYLLQKEPTALVEKITLPELPNKWLTQQGMVRISKDALVDDFFVALIRKSV